MSPHRTGAALTTSIVTVTIQAADAPGKPSRADRLAGPVIGVLSNRPDLVSGGDMLVGVRPPRAVDVSKVRVRVEWRAKRRVRGRLRTVQRSRGVTRAFAVRADGRFAGLVRGLPLGRSTLRATAGRRRSASAVIVNHPHGGPVLSGPQVKHQDRAGKVIYGGRPLGPPPGRPPAGWSSPAFQGGMLR